MSIRGRGARRGLAAASVVLGYLAGGGAGYAETADRFEAFIESDGHVERAVGSVLAADDAMPPACRQRRVDRRVDTEILLLPRFEGAAGGPTEGAWMESWAVTRCGETRQVNLHFAVSRGGEIAVDVAIPGETAADPDQQLGVMQALSPYARDALGGCAEFAVIDSKIAGFPPDALPAQGADDPVAWSERWTVAGCGASETFMIRFMPGEDRSLVDITQQ